MTELQMTITIQARDPAGLEALMDQYFPYVSAVVWHILHASMQKEDMEEVVSDVFLAAWNQPKDLQPGKLKAWLGAVARNRAKNKLRQLHPAHPSLPLEDDILELPGPDNTAQHTERLVEAELIQEALHTLSKEDREIFLRYYYYAQTIDEISAVTGFHPSTIKTRLHRGRAKLKTVLTKGGFEP